MMPLVVLRRLDLLLEPTKDKVLAEHQRLVANGMKEAALDKALSRVATGNKRKQHLYNISPFTFQKLLGDPPNIANNLLAYIHGFSPRPRDIFDKFDFEAEIYKLEEANRLYLIIQEFCNPDIDLAPERVSNLQMGYPRRRCAGLSGSNQVPCNARQLAFHNKESRRANEFAGLQANLLVDPLSTGVPGRVG
jgi:type I restriction enzyme M protein